ncbi:uncharacterized protein LOC130290249 isoform X3 [Hyla sarda]|uniref:uncharacterized protein LOC130290249 isoform X3 n=1 Tax=Hyla sarda TaxID=327740 RepID=UPI0024C41393|nr:uncharacterized protein LOC130290249 isoform X3 [Hyla sarda]
MGSVNDLGNQMRQYLLLNKEVNLRKNLKKAQLNAPLPENPMGKLKHIYLIFLDAKIARATSWKAQSIPFYLVRSKINWIMTNDKLTRILLDSQNAFDITWLPWMEYLSTLSLSLSLNLI